MKRQLSLFLCFLLVFGIMTSDVAPIYGDTDNILKIGVTEEPDSLSPFIAYERGAFELFMIVYDSLICFDENLKTVPSLAESWEISSDNLTWTFHLRKDVKWHDGEPFTAKDVKFTYERMKESELGLYVDMVKDIDTIEIPDDYTIVFGTSTPKSNMLQNITPILPEHILKDISMEDLETFENESLIGTGPFKFREWKKNEYLSLDANKDYFKGAPKVDGLIFTMFANRDTMAQSVKLGEIDVALGLYKNNVKTIQEEKGTEIYEFSENGFTELAFNCWEDKASKGNPLILDKTIRQAIEYAIDKQKIIDMVYEGAGDTGTTMIPKSQKYFHYEPTAEELRNYAPDKAKELLDSADYIDRDNDGIRENKAGKKLSFKFLLRSENTLEVKAGQMIKSYLRDVGIDTVIETIDDGALNDRIFSTADYDMFIWGWGGDVDPGTLLRVLITDQIGNLNDSYYSNPDYDELVSLQSTKLDSSERQKTIWDAQKLLYEDLPYIILLYSIDLQVVRTDRITGIKPTVNGAVFYADTPYNYLNAEMADMTEEAPAQAAPVQNTEEKKSNVGIIITGVIIAAAVVAYFSKKSKKSKEEEW